ncbi:MAG: hypothetical protein WBF06_05145 [Candidatus Acidiferrales bacterium]
MREEEEVRRFTKRLRYAHEILFSLATGFWVGIGGFLGLFPPLRLTSVPFAFLEKALFHTVPRFGIFLSNREYVIAAAYLNALLAAVLIFVFLRLISRTLLARWIVYSAAGPIVLLCVPAGWLFETHFLPVLRGPPNPPRPVLMLELATALFCALLYLDARHWVPKWVGALLLSGHTALWFWVAGGGAYRKFGFSFVVLSILTFCSMMAWSFYVASLSKQVT